MSPWYSYDKNPQTYNPYGLMLIRKKELHMLSLTYFKITVCQRKPRALIRKERYRNYDSVFIKLEKHNQHIVWEKKNLSWAPKK